MFSVQMDNNDYNRVMKALDRIESAVKKEAANLSRECAVKVKLLLVEAVLTEKYDYDPYNPKYKKHKAKKVGHLKFWLYEGALLKSLAAYKSGTNAWAVGITPGAVNTKGRKAVGVEIYATRHEKKRPLFSQIRSEFVTHGGEWNRLGNQALLKTVEHWKG